MARKASRNLGQCSLRRKRRRADPMAAFDALPAPLRQWLSEAALPWSPASAQKIWSNARANGRSTEEALTSLNQIEARMLARDTESSIHQRN
ncbi:MAG: DUF6525 family protein [Litoreibacter sp.]|nr:DUF6525 family protein [Litoreibacter sp.]MCY4335446.1 DUF6525 family protein [Litoreibacter sp.]